MQELLRLIGPSDDDIYNWLITLSRELGFFRLNFSEPHHWQLYAQNSATTYYLDLYVQGLWLTYGTVLVHDVNEGQQGDFHGGLLDLNAEINGASIGRDSGFVMLTRAQPKRDLTIVSLAESLFIMNSVHEYVYHKVYELIGNLNLRANN